MDRLEHTYAKTVGKITRRNGWGVPGVSWTPGIDHLED
jgi:peptide deformylase